MNVLIGAHLIQDGENFETEIEDGTCEWDSESTMWCEDCRHRGRVKEFECPVGCVGVEKEETT